MARCFFRCFEVTIDGQMNATTMNTIWSLTVSQDAVATDRVGGTLCDTLICCMGKEPQGCGSLRVSSCVLLW